MDSIIDRHKDTLLSDYFLYFLVVCLKESSASNDGWCSINVVFKNFVVGRDYVIKGKNIYFTFDFGDSIDELANYLVTYENYDMINTVFRFIWSIKESTAIDLYCKYNMDKFWLKLSHRLNYSINIDSKKRLLFQGKIIRHGESLIS